jgi:hypothetical protein
VDWLAASGDPLSYAPLFQSAPLGGSEEKRILFQMALGDMTVLNPSTTALVRAAGMEGQTSVYRFDLAKKLVPGLLADPHSFLVPLGPQEQYPISIAALTQAVLFLSSDTALPPDVNPMLVGLFGVELFETRSGLPDDFGFVK